jgi:hypothetical protein
MGRIPAPPPPPPAHHDPALSPAEARALTPVEELWDDYKRTAPPELLEDPAEGDER